MPTTTQLERFVRQIRMRARALRHQPDQPHQVEDVTFRPKRAENVRLVGPMTESAFATQPWLVERAGKFLQLTELLYRITELADGTRSIDQIAVDASTASGTEVPPDFVRRMVESRLVPVGIISGTAGVGARPATAASAAVSNRSPLALNMRMAVVSPRLIDAVTRVLKYLYAPPVLLLMLFVIVQSQYWLLFVHGIAAGVSQAFTTPSVLPIALALVVCSAGFHELGHAAALRFGGGQVRGMGVGLYLMYPAFYTDVTDNYRLGRWARVRTDLGGFYFNLLFSLGLMGVYHVTGQEFLLVVALLTDIEIIHQCLPFVRLDGYWALADLTGIPDFFSFMGAYLRSVVPGLGGKGRKLPKLKWWAKAVFGLYIAVSVPTIALLLFATVKSAPRVVITAFASAHQQMAAVALAEASGDALGAAGAEAQLLLLLLPPLGLGIMLASLGRAFATALWRWGKPTRGRRFASGLIAAGVGALFLFLWLPGLADLDTYATLFNRLRAPLDVSAAEPIAASEGGTIPQAVVAAMPAMLTSPPNAVTPALTPVATPETTPPAAASPDRASEPTEASAETTATPSTPSTLAVDDSAPTAATSQNRTVTTPSTGHAAVQPEPTDATQADPTRTPVTEGSDIAAVDPTRTPAVNASRGAEPGASGVAVVSGTANRTVSAPPTERAVATAQANSEPTALPVAPSAPSATPARSSTVQARPAQTAAPPVVSTVPAARATPTPAQNSPGGAQAGPSGAQVSPTAQATLAARQPSPSSSPAISPVPSPATN